MGRHRGGNRARKERRDMKSWRPDETPRRYDEPKRQRGNPLQEYERDEGDGRYE